MRRALCVRFCPREVCVESLLYREGMCKCNCCGLAVFECSFGKSQRGGDEGGVGLVYAEEAQLDVCGEGAEVVAA